MIALLLALQFYVTAPIAQRGPETLAEGTWTSCPLDDGSGDYGEKALDYSVKGHPWFEIHYGPRDEFAIFAGNTPEHIDHADERNKLRPAYHFGDLQTASGRNWSVASLGVHLNVARIDGQRVECYSFIVKLERDERQTWANR